MAIFTSMTKPNIEHNNLFNPISEPEPELKL